MTPALTPDERPEITDAEAGRRFLRGHLAGLKQCSATHDELAGSSFDSGWEDGYEEGRSGGRRDGALVALLVVFGLAAVAGALARRWGR